MLLAFLPRRLQKLLARQGASAAGRLQPPVRHLRRV